MISCNIEGELGSRKKISGNEDFKEIMPYGVMKTPALVVDEKVKVTGRVLSAKDIKKHLILTMIFLYHLMNS